MMSKNPKLEDILNKQFGIKIHQVGRADLGIPDEYYYAKDKRVEQAQQAIYQAGLEIIGEDDEVTRIDRKTDNDVLKEARNDYRAELRSKWAEFCGKEQGNE